jgi:hypothetical protein
MDIDDHEGCHKTQDLQRPDHRRNLLPNGYQRISGGSGPVSAHGFLSHHCKSASGLRYGVAKLLGSLNPGTNGIFNIGQSILWGFTVAHAARKIRHGRNETPAIFSSERFYDNRIVIDIHVSLLKASTKDTSFLIYTGFMGRLKGMVNFIGILA